MSSRTQGDELLLEELEHFRHEVLFALQVNVHIVLRKVISSYREKQNDGLKLIALPGGKAMSSFALKNATRAPNKEFRFFRCAKSFLKWINFTLDDMREELSERLSNNDANCMNDEDQS